MAAGPRSAPTERVERASRAPPRSALVVEIARVPCVRTSGRLAPRCTGMFPAPSQSSTDVGRRFLYVDIASYSSNRDKVDSGRCNRIGQRERVVGARIDVENQAGLARSILLSNLEPAFWPRQRSTPQLAESP